MDIVIVIAMVLLHDHPSIVIGTAAATTESPNVAIAFIEDVHPVRCNKAVTESYTWLQLHLTLYYSSFLSAAFYELHADYSRPRS
jgi:hypothetical protein